MPKFIMRLATEFEADTPEKAQGIAIEQIKNGFNMNVMIELAQLPDDVDEQVKTPGPQEGISFEDLLKSFNTDNLEGN